MISKLLAKYGSDKVPRGKERGHSYGPFYDELFSHNPTDILEVGVHFGYSVSAWCEAFLEARIVGIDIDPIFKGKEPKNFYYLKFDVKNCNFAPLVKFDIIIDDGSHLKEDQMWVIENLSKHLKENGKLVIEDIQVYEYLEDFKKVVPKGFKMEVVDLRGVQGWTDDLLAVISRI